MVLINCPECGREVSDKATACPQCAYPLAAPSPEPHVTPVATPPGAVVTTEKTGKAWKVWQFMGASFAVIGTVAALAFVASGWSAGPGIFLTIAGLVIFLIGRIGAWWEHG